MARLEALITVGQLPSPHVAFSLVKAPVPHGLPAGSLFQAPFFTAQPLRAVGVLVSPMVSGWAVRAVSQKP